MSNWKILDANENLDLTKNKIIKAQYSKVTSVLRSNHPAAKQYKPLTVSVNLNNGDVTEKIDLATHNLKI